MRIPCDEDIVLAESAKENSVGTKVEPLGFARIHVLLAPHEEVRVGGEVELTKSGDGSLALSYDVVMEAASFNPPSQPTPLRG